MKRTFEEIKNDKKLAKFHEMNMNKFNVVSIDNLRVADFNDAYKLIINRLVNKMNNNNTRNVSKMKDDILILSIYNDHINFAKELTKRYIHQLQPEERSNAQISYSVFADNKIKKILKAKEDSFKAPSFFTGSLRTVLLVVESLAKVTYPDEIMVASSKSSRIMKNMLLDDEILEKFCEIIDARIYNLRSFYHDYLFIDGELTIRKIEDISHFDLLVELTNIYIQKWFGFDEIEEFDDYKPLITDLNEIRLYTYMTYGINFIKGQFNNMSLECLNYDTDDKIAIIYDIEQHEKNEQFPVKLPSSERPATLPNNTSYVLDLLEESTKKEDLNYFNYNKEFIWNAYGDTKISEKDLDGVTLSFMYYLFDCCIYAGGEYDQGHTRRNIEAVNKKFNQYYDELKDKYDFYAELEKKLDRGSNFALHYDEFDSTLFKKLLAILEFLATNEGHIDEAKKFFYKLVGSKKQATSAYKTLKIDNLYCGELEGVVAVASVVCDIDDRELPSFETEDIAEPKLLFLAFFVTQVNPFERLAHFRKESKTFRNYLKFFKAHDETVLTMAELEFYKRVWVNTNFLNLRPNTSNFFYHVIGDENSTYKNVIKYSNLEKALMTTSLKAVVDDEKEEVTDEELALYKDRYLREIQTRNRANFRDSFYDTELQNKEVIIKEKDNYINELEAKRKENAELVNNLKQQLSEQQNNFDRTLNQAKKEIINSYKAKESEYRSEIKELQAEIAKLKAANEKLEFQNERLENAMFEEETESSDIRLEDVIGNSKITVVGGRYEKLRELQEQFPNNITIILDANFSESAILNADYVICLYNFLAHGTYYKVKKLMNVRSERFMYCQFDNLDLIKSQLAKTIISCTK